MLLFFHSFTTPCLSFSLSFSHSLSSHLSSSLYLPPPTRLIVNVAAIEAWRHWPTSRPKPPISFRPTPPSALDPCCRSKCLLVVVLAHGYWVANWKTYGARQPSSPTLCLFVIGDFVWFGLREKIGNLVFFFFFLLPAVDCWW